MKYGCAFICFLISAVFFCFMFLNTFHNRDIPFDSLKNEIDICSDDVVLSDYTGSEKSYVQNLGSYGSQNLSKIDFQQFDNCLIPIDFTKREDFPLSYVEIFDKKAYNDVYLHIAIVNVDALKKDLKESPVSDFFRINPELSDDYLYELVISSFWSKYFDDFRLIQLNPSYVCDDIHRYYAQVYTDSNLDDMNEIYIGPVDTSKVAIVALESFEGCYAGMQLYMGDLIQVLCGKYDSLVEPPVSSIF